jgi:hypothetical protein
MAPAAEINVSGEYDDTGEGQGRLPPINIQSIFVRRKRFPKVDHVIAFLVLQAGNLPHTT